ncbi:MAG: NAD(P)/FAD-dependent oxidoreductase [Dehalococcoidia bacterium]
MAGKTVLILGGGVGGLVAANELRHRLSKEHRIIVVDREREHRFQASYLWLMVGWRKPAAISRDLAALNRRGIEYRQADVLSIDLPNNAVETSGGTIPYDYLVIALGAELDLDAIPGLAQAGHTPYDFQGAAKLKEVWQTFRGGSVAVVIASTPFKCPAAPYETALLLDYALRQKGIRDEVNISLFTPEALPMAVAGPAVGQALVRMLAERDIRFNPGHKLATVDAEQRRLRFENEREAGFDLLVYVPPHRPPAVVRQSGLSGEVGWIPVDRNTLKTGRDHVYALGDVAAVSLPNGMMLPKAGVFAHGQAQVVAHNIAAEIDGRGQERPFDGWGGCFIEVGGGRAAYGSGHFFAEPSPAVQLYEPARSWHMGKALLEKAWLQAVGPSPLIARGAFWAMDLGNRTLLEQHWLWRRF